jgi:hypothetical protein
MKRLEILYFCRFGFHAGRLHEASFSEHPLSHLKLSSVFESTREWLEEFSNVEWTDFPKSRSAGRTLLKFIEPFLKDLGTERKLTQAEWNSIIHETTQFHNVFKQEMQDTFVYLVTPIGAYSVPILVKEAEKHLSELALKHVNEQAKHDFNLAGYCLSLNLWTASGFHSMRALEMETRIYHKIVTGIELSDSPFGALIKGDNKVKGSGLSPWHEKNGGKSDSPLGLIISILSHINKIYRCPIMHPEMTLDSATAKQVFDIGAIAVSAIIADGLELRKKQNTATSNP